MTVVETLVLEGDDARARGEAQGETWREEIRQLYAIRLALMLEKTDLVDEDEVLALAARHLPVLERFDVPLAVELAGIAHATGLTPAHLVVLNHYTDMRDLGRAHLDDSGCSALYAPRSAGGGPLLGQTWDTHGSATDFVRLLDVRTARGRTLLFTITGCLGMAGLNDRGLALTINNLNSVDAHIGVVWPALVRVCLEQDSARAARDVVLGAELGSGHHYVVADEHEVYGIETSGTRKKVIQQGADTTHLHTNHCLDAEMQATAVVSPTSTTQVRYDRLVEALANDGAPTSASGLFELLGIVSAPRTPDNGSAVATCGVFVADLAARTALCVQGPAGPGLDVTVVELPKRSPDHG